MMQPEAQQQTKLSPEELRKIASFLHSQTIAGQRYAASDLVRVNS
jgi:hypothetical protein